ncbi:putative retrotransposon protein [Cucumis melo var. makuwa]|uniref:Retrotransposon protein n=1 Tax=Cucumis melo var. makuwa TaxID=1194695 RepID=A0A5A7U2A2_CUCMM|nr:putative retrotransposon protein [Cucumis melo var. makuwa]
MSYNMHKKEKSLNKLHGMLKTAELNIKSSFEDLMIRKGKNPKKREQYQGTKPKSPKEGEYYHCKEIGHWKRNCPLYLEELKKNKGSVPSTSSVFVIEDYEVVGRWLKVKWINESGIEQELLH